jgi:hypothetical protein
MMLHFLQTALLNPAYRDDTSTVQAWRERVLSANLVILATLGTLGYLVFLISDIQRGMQDPSYLREIPVNTAGYVLVMIVALWRRLNFRVRAGFLILVLAGVALSDKLAAGLGGIGELMLMTASVLLVIFFGRWGAAIAAVMVLAVMGIPGWLITSGQVALPERETVLSADPAAWAMTTFVVLILAGMLVASVMVLLEGLAAPLHPHS